MLLITLTVLINKISRLQDNVIFFCHNYLTYKLQPYCARLYHLQPVWLCHISSSYLKNGTIFGKKSI